MNEAHTHRARRLEEVVLVHPGTTEPALRRAVEAHAARQRGSLENPPEDAESIPAGLGNYIDKVALHAYKVTDEDVAGLRRAGYSDAAIFELTVCAAVGSGMARLGRGLAALMGGGECASPSGIESVEAEADSGRAGRQAI